MFLCKSQYYIKKKWGIIPPLLTKKQLPHVVKLFGGNLKKSVLLLNNLNKKNSYLGRKNSFKCSQQFSIATLIEGYNSLVFYADPGIRRYCFDLAKSIFPLIKCV